MNDLKVTHGQMRNRIRQLAPRLECASPTQFAIFDGLYEKLQNLIGWFHEHSQQENELLLEALLDHDST